MRPSKFTPSLCTGEGGVFGGMYFYHSICNFMPMPNAAFGSSFLLRHFLSAVFVAHNRAARHAISILEKIELVRLRWVSGWSRSDWGLVVCVLVACLLAVLCPLVCVGAAALLSLAVCPCWAYSSVCSTGTLLVRVCAGRGQPLCPWDRGDKVVSSCWWVRACFIHPETLFQTLSH